MQCTYFSFCEKLSIHNEHGFYAASIPSETQADGRGSPVVCLMDARSSSFFHCGALQNGMTE